MSGLGSTTAKDNNTPQVMVVGVVCGGVDTPCGPGGQQHRDWDTPAWSPTSCSLSQDPVSKHYAASWEVT